MSAVMGWQGSTTFGEPKLAPVRALIPPWAMDDGLLQEILVVTLAMGACLAAVLGHWPRLAGTYTEGGQNMVLRHAGFLVWGQSHVAGGTQTFWGLTWQGRLMLRRYDAGRAHLIRLGFPEAHLQALHGACTGSFLLRHRPDGSLFGVFYGRRFRLADGHMRAVERLPGQERVWRTGVDPSMPLG